MQRPSRFPDGRGVVMEKRVLDSDLGDEQPEPKRPKVPALASVIVEALKVDSLQKLCSSLEPILRRVVSEEVERALAKLGPARIGGRTSPKRIEGPDGRNLQLHFRSRLSLPLFTGGKVEGEQGAAIHIVLIDANTGLVVTSGPESFAKLDVVVLEGDFNNEDEDGWTEEEFESHIVKEREGKRPILTGDLQVPLKEGVGTLGDITFTDNSSWIRSRKFRLGLRIASGYCEGVRIREAKTEAFTVKDHRGELYKKHYPPALKDEVWRLEKIGKDGSFHKRLNKAGIYTVEDFLRHVVRDPQKLRTILGSGMSNKMWESLVEHAKTCVLSGKLYVYYPPDSARNVGAIFNNIYEFTGLIVGGQYFSLGNLSESQKVFADSLVKKAYDNWMHVIEYDGKALLDTKQSKKTGSSKMDSAIAPGGYGSYDQQVSLPRLPSSTSSDASSVESGLVVRGGVGGGEYDIHASRYGTQSQQVTMNSHVQLGNSPYTTQNQFISSSLQLQASRNDTRDIGLGSSQQSNFTFQQPAMPAQTPNSTFDDWFRPRDSHVADDFLSEEEIRMRSHELLENEDMQQLLHVFSMGGTSGLNDDGYAFTPYLPPTTPNYNYDLERGRSGKAVVGWLKIKAAMRWGIFIRKKAAERRRAQLVELEDST